MKPLSLSDDVLDAYKRDGFYLAKGLFTQDEAAAMRRQGHDIIARLAERHDVRGTWEAADQDAVTTGNQPTELQHCHDMQLHSAVFTQRLCDPRLAGTFAQLMGTDNVQLHHNKFFIKAPERGSPFPFHQDWPFFPHANETPMAAIVHLDDAPEEKGCVRLVPGSQSRGRLDHQSDKQQFYLGDGAIDPADAIVVPAQAGDVLFFGYLMVHGSGINTSNEPRTTWLIQVRDPSDTPTVLRHQSPGQGTMLIGSNTTSPPPPTSL